MTNDDDTTQVSNGCRATRCGVSQTSAADASLAAADAGDDTSTRQHRREPSQTRTIVIGTGFGGAVASCRLAQAGYDVTVLERGRRYAPEDFPALPTQDAPIPDFARYLWQQDCGLWEVLNLDALVSLQAAGYGGGSLICANVHLRPPEGVFDREHWPEAYAEPGALERYFDLAGFMLDARPLDAERSRRLRKVVQLEQSARARGQPDAFFLPPLTVNFQAGKDGPWGPRPACNECARCVLGCPTRAKNTLDTNYLAIAEQRGAKVKTLSEVVSIQRRGSGFRVVYRDHLHGRDEERQLDAECVFLCAGAIHSARLVSQLNESPVAPEAALTGSQLAGIGYYPNADAFGVVYDTKQPLGPSQGPTIGGSLIHWNSAALVPADFFLVQDGGYPEALTPLSNVLRAGLWLEQNRRAPHGAGARAGGN